MTASGQEPAPAPQPRTPYVVTRPAASANAPKPSGAATLDRPSEDHIDEPGYGHGV
jgi:hypothetical protein